MRVRLLGSAPSPISFSTPHRTLRLTHRPFHLKHCSTPSRILAPSSLRASRILDPSSLRRGQSLTCGLTHHISTRSYATQSSSSGGEKSHLVRNGLLAVTLLAAAGVAYQWETGALGTGNGQTKGSKTFETAIRTSKGIMQHTHTLLSEAETEDLLHQNEKSTTFSSTPGVRSLVIRYDTNSVASNDPIEDRHAENAIPRSLITEGLESAPADAGSLPGIKLFSVIDGHSGFATSQLLSKTMHPTIVLALRSLYAGHPPELPGSNESGILRYINSWFAKLSPPQIDPKTLSDALISAYVTLDDQIVKPPLRLVPHFPVKPGQQNPRPIVVPTVAPAVSGAVAISMMVDEAREELYVANTGDCRAVAGYWVEPKDGQEGGWRCEVLTEDLMGENPKEVERMRREHPREDAVIMRGRIMGGLQPTRAFGDSPKYKWTNEEAEGVKSILPKDSHLREKIRTIEFNRTPPYVTARPEITYKKIPKSGAPGTEGELQFVIMATDGIWDCLTSSEAVALVAAHMKEPVRAGPVSQQAVNNLVKYQSPESQAKYPGPDSPVAPNLRTLDWVFKDENASTHLVRNALVGSRSRKTVQELLSLKPPVSRWLRDDMTCTVVFFGPNPDDQGAAIASAGKTGFVKAKL